MFEHDYKAILRLYNLDFYKTTIKIFVHKYLYK